MAEHASFSDIVNALPHLLLSELQSIRDIAIEMAPLEKRQKSRRKMKTAADLRMERIKSAVRIWEQYNK